MEFYTVHRGQKSERRSAGSSQPLVKILASPVAILLTSIFLKILKLHTLKDRKPPRLCILFSFIFIQVENIPGLF
jgi:hypothetical protein